MDDLQFEVQLALVAAQAGVLAEISEQSLGWRALWDFRLEHPERRQQTTAELVRYAFLTYEPDMALRILRMEEGELEPELSSLYEIAIRCLKMAAVDETGLERLRRAATEDPIWHFPLGLERWAAQDDTFAHHFEWFCYLLRPDYREPLGWFRSEVMNFVRYPRACRVCRMALAQKQLTGTDSLLFVCLNCYGLERSFSRGELAEGRVSRDDSRIEHLAKLSDVFDFGALVSTPSPMIDSRRSSKPLKTRLAYRKLSTLERCLDDGSRSLLQRADQIAQEAGLVRANSCALLLSWLEVGDWRAESEAGLEAARNEAQRALLEDDCDSLAEILNVALWQSVLGRESRTILQAALESAIVLTSRGRSADIVMEHLALTASQAQWVFLNARSPEQEADLLRLRKRYPFRYLRLAATGVAVWSDPDLDGYLGFFRGESLFRPYLGPLFAKGKVAARVMEAWRTSLLDGGSEYQLIRAEQCFLVHYPRIARGLARLRMRQGSGSFPLFQSLHCDPYGESLIFALDALDWLERREVTGSSGKFQRWDLAQAMEVAFAAKLYERARSYGEQLLEFDLEELPDLWVRQSAIHILGEVASIERDYQGIVDLAGKMPSLRTEDVSMALRLVLPLWKAGLQTEFHAALKTMASNSKSPEAGEYLIEISNLYRRVEAHWSKDDIKALEALRL